MVSKISIVQKNCGELLLTNTTVVLQSKFLLCQKVAWFILTNLWYKSHRRLYQKSRWAFLLHGLKVNSYMFGQQVKESPKINTGLLTCWVLSKKSILN